ncbi:MAG: amidophosphoribosyltransferase [Bacteroidetes bacterium]|nr:MAG: amidophosphoribosyltransferase [Bacteroidota bacterium]
MSEQIKHECGIALVRLLKPLEYYQSKYGTWQYGLQKLYLLMEKQRNRGQDGAGVACVKFDLQPGNKYIHRVRSNASMPIVNVFDEINSKIELNQELANDASWSKQNLPFAGELYLGHLRYGTFGRNNIDNVHPVMRENNWKSRNLVVAGNFNLTNVDELFQTLIDLGQYPKDYSDTVTILEKLGHFLDEENQILFNKFKKQGFSNKEISKLIAQELNVKHLLCEASQKWDGGYVIAGLIGHGDAFINRDPNGIRPAYYYYDDEIVVATSERAAIQTVLKVPIQSIKEIKPGSALIIKKDGTISEEQIRQAKERKSCSFERIYFSRGSDFDIYKERKKLGELLAPAIYEALSKDIKNAVFSFIPNTAETAFYGMMEGMDHLFVKEKKRILAELGNDITDEQLEEIVSLKLRVEKIAVKDVKLRTFISEDKSRNDIVEHVYDITYGTIKRDVDSMVVIDDSIVRGTTLKQSILKILDRLGPRQIVIVSSAPQIRYPDCYGIDMAKLNDFVAFNAAIELLKETGRENIINDVYQKSKKQQSLPKEQIVNYVKEIYEPFSDEEISNKISQLLRPKNIKADVKIIYQTVERLHQACPNDLGDWYFTGDYPTPGGNKVVNSAFINYVEGKNIRAY